MIILHVFDRKSPEKFEFDTLNPLFCIFKLKKKQGKIYEHYRSLGFCLLLLTFTKCSFCVFQPFKPPNGIWNIFRVELRAKHIDVDWGNIFLVAVPPIQLILWKYGNVSARLLGLSQGDQQIETLRKISDQSYLFGYFFSQNHVFHHQKPLFYLFFKKWRRMLKRYCVEDFLTCKLR